MKKINNYFNKFASLFYNPVEISSHYRISDSNDSVIVTNVKKNTLTGKVSVTEKEVMSVIFSKENVDYIQGLID